MALNSIERDAIVKYRIERANEALREAEYNFAGKFYNLTANRLYYACFYACQALLIKNGISPNSHQGVFRMISLHFVNTQKLDRNDALMVKTFFKMRQSGDYDDMFDWTKEELEPLIPEAKKLIERILLLLR